MFGDDETTAAITAAAETSGEMMWRLPITEETPRSRAHREQDRRPAAARLGALGLRPLRGGVPAASSSATTAMGAPRHRRAGVQRRRPVGPRARPGRPATRSRRSWRTPLRWPSRPARDDRARADESDGLDSARAVELLAQLLLAPLLLAAGCTPASGPGCRPARRHSDGTPLRLANLCAHCTDGTRAAGPLPVVRDQQQGHVGDRGARLDEPSTPRRVADELQQVSLVRVVGPAHCCRHRRRSAAAAPAPEAIEQTHGHQCAA